MLIVPHTHRLHDHGPSRAHPVGAAHHLLALGGVGHLVDQEEVRDEGEVEADAAVLAEHEHEAVELLLLPGHAPQDAVGRLLRVLDAALRPAGGAAVVEARRPLVARPTWLGFGLG